MSPRATCDIISPLWRAKFIAAVPLQSLITHDSVPPSQCSWNRVSVVIDASSEVMPRHRRPYKGFAGRLSLSDALGAAEEAVSGQPDASKTLLHTFQPPPTARPWHEFRGGACRISVLFQMTFNRSPWLTSQDALMAFLETWNDRLAERHLGSFSLPL